MLGLEGGGDSALILSGGCKGRESLKVCISIHML